MDEWNTTHHTRSGLVDRVRASDYDEERATDETLAFLREWVPENASPMCGNTICQDRRFMARHLPRLEAYFHYRNQSEFKTLNETLTLKDHKHIKVVGEEQEDQFTVKVGPGEDRVVRLKVQKEGNAAYSYAATTSYFFQEAIPLDKLK